MNILPSGHADGFKVRKLRYSLLLELASFFSFFLAYYSLGIPNTLCWSHLLRLDEFTGPFWDKPCSLLLEGLGLHSHLGTV